MRSRGGNASSRESGVKGKPILVPDVFAFDAGRLVRVQGNGRPRQPVTRGRLVVRKRREIRILALLGCGHAEREAGEHFP
jgi:hypothetical protein